LILQACFQDGGGILTDKLKNVRVNDTFKERSKLWKEPKIMMRRHQLEGAEVRSGAFWLLIYSSTNQHPTAPVLLVGLLAVKYLK